MKTFLMCEPDYFDVVYEINPHMVGNIDRVDVDIAVTQWETLYEHVSSVANVQLIRQAPEFPDMVFVANAATVDPDNNVAVISNFKHKQRQGEAALFRDWFDFNGWNTTTHADVAFEGAGDCLVDRYREFWFGHGQRSNAKMIDRLTADLSVPYIHELELVDPRWYHLDTCFCPLDNGYYLATQAAFSAESWAYLAATIGDKLIPVSTEDALRFACNAISIGDTVIIPQCSEELQVALSVVGCRVITVNMSEFIKSGGAAKCLVLELYQDY